MAENSPALFEPLLDALLAARESAYGKVAPRLTWLPNDWEPYALDATVVIVVLLALVAAWKRAAELWRIAVWVPKTLWRRRTGYREPKSETAIAVEAATRAEEAALRSEKNTEEILRNQVEAAKQAGEAVLTDALERAVAAAREVLQSNDPSKAEAQLALRNDDLRGAEDALAKAFEREVQDYTRLDDQTQQLKAKAARTAREKAALAATRSVAEAILWYERAAGLDPGNCWTHVELARLHRAKGDLGAALGAAQRAVERAENERDLSVALDEIGDVLVAQGDLGTALESFQASMVIAERLARADASNAGLQRDLSVSHERIGDLHEARGEIAAAIEAYERSLVIAQSLADRFPDHPQFQSDLPITKRRLGQLRAQSR